MTKKPLDPFQTFLIGYDTAYIGIPFRAIYLLGATAKEASLERQPLLEGQIAKLRSNNSTTIEFVSCVDGMLAAAGLYQPPKPHDLYDWFQWAIDARRAVAVMLDAKSPLLRTMLAGEAYGTFAAAMAIEDILLYSRDATLPSLVGDRRHREAAEEVDTATRHIEEARIGQPTAYVTAVDELVEAARQLPSLDSAQERAVEVRRLVLLANSHLTALNEAFRAEGDRYRAASA